MLTQLMESLWRGSRIGDESAPAGARKPYRYLARCHDGRAHARRAAGRAAVALLAVSSLATARDHGISAPAGIEQARYSEFADLSPVEMWHTLDAMEFWSIPLAPPSDYYDSVNPATRDTLRRSLHEIVRD